MCLQKFPPCLSKTFQRNTPPSSVDISNRPGVLNLYSLIYPLKNFKSKIYPQIFFILLLLQMPIVVDKSVSFLLTKFIPKAGQIDPQAVNLPLVESP